MSYIVQSTNPLLRVKLTETGREKLAQGNLTFNSWAAGDSEINYGITNITQTPTSGNYKVLRPFDRNPDIKSKLVKSDGTKLTNFNSGDILVTKCIVSNEAEVRGFFSDEDLDDMLILTSTTYVKGFGVIDTTDLNGTDLIDLGTSGFAECDFLLIKVTNDTLGDIGITETVNPVPYLWFKLESLVSGTTYQLDRILPEISGATGTLVDFFVYPGGDPIFEYYGSGSTTAYWSTGTLEFDTACDISIDNVPILNMNIPCSETMAGYNRDTPTFHVNPIEFGSTDYAGTPICLGYLNECPSDQELGADPCTDTIVASVDGQKRCLGIIHYTNNSISNFYGEYFHIDHDLGKQTALFLPTLMWHRRDFATGSGDTMGMRFVTTGITQFVESTELEYFDLVEDPSFISSSRNPLIVGKVFPQLKLVVFDDQEIVAAMSYKSNRNWTLPRLGATLVSPNSGSGALAPGEKMFLTYTLETDIGIQDTLPAQKYVVLENTTSTGKDIQFNINGLDFFAYMRKIEDGGYDGLGFYAHTFKLLVNTDLNILDRPIASAWKEIDYTTGITAHVAGETIRPTDLENQNPVVNNFILSDSLLSAAVDYNLPTDLGIPTTGSPDGLNFGFERFFYGNLETFIGATIYKTLFNIRLSESDIESSENESWTEGVTKAITEVGIYDNEGELVVIGKFSEPIFLLDNTIAQIELTIDF